MCLKGTVASTFLMGAGGHLRWLTNESEVVDEVQQRFNAVLTELQACAQPDGFSAGFRENDTMYREAPSYVLSWFIHGLVESNKAVSAPRGAGRVDPLLVARRMIDWFSAPQKNTLLPEFLPADRTTDDVPVHIPVYR